MHLWKAGLPQNERKEILGRLEAILHTCRNSAFKHLKDGNVERLNWRIEEIRADLNELAGNWLKTILWARKFLRNSVNCTVVFARLAAKGMEAPYTNNRIERLMGEIANRA